MENNPMNLQTPDQKSKGRIKRIILSLLVVTVAGFTIYYFMNSEGGLFQGKMAKIEPVTKNKEENNNNKIRPKTESQVKAKTQAEAEAKAKAEAEFRAELERQKAEREAREAADAENTGDDDDEEEENNENAENSENINVEQPEIGEMPLAETYGTLTIDQNGTVSSARVDEDEVTIAKFRISADENADASRISLQLTGSVNAADVQNFKLYQSGYPDPISQVATINNNNKIVFDLDDYRIHKGDIKSFFVTADLNPGRISDEIKIYLDQDSDITTIGRTYDIPLAINKTNYDGTNCSRGPGSDCTYVPVE